MKKILVKRLIYSDGASPDRIGGHDYDGKLSDANILGAVHEVGKTQWIGQSLWLMKCGRPIYRITVATFTQYQKSWYDLILDAVKRI